MPVRNKIYNIIKPAADADFVNDVYYQVYASSAASPTINGQVVSLAAGTTIDIILESISATANVFVIGDKRYSVDTSTSLSKYPEP